MFADGMLPFLQSRVHAAHALRSSVVVLVVEDDRSTRELHRDALSHAGYSVVAVEDGVDALRYLERHTPSAVVLDLGLPRLTGQDLHREMAAHEETGRIPVVVVTGQSGPINERDFARVLRKPIDPDQLVVAVENCLRNR